MAVEFLGKEGLIMFDELLPNLVAELIGIAVTVFGVDYLIKRREQQRWSSSRDLLYANLLEAVGNLIGDIIPIRARKRSFVYLEFGEVRVLQTISPDRIDPYVLNGILDQLIKVRAFDLELISKRRLQIESIISPMAFLLDPEAFSLVMKLDRKMNLLFRREFDLTEDDSVSDLAINLSVVLNSAIDVSAWLEGRVDRRLSPGEVNRDSLLKNALKSTHYSK
jgi:hypothetical protein